MMPPPVKPAEQLVRAVVLSYSLPIDHLFFTVLGYQQFSEAPRNETGFEYAELEACLTEDSIAQQCVSTFTIPLPDFHSSLLEPFQSCDPKGQAAGRNVSMLSRKVHLYRCINWVDLGSNRCLAQHMGHAHCLIPCFLSD